jgi:predicted RecB family nuclease
VDDNLAGELHRRQVDTVEQLLVSFTEETLSELKRPWGAKTQRVGKRAAPILLMARAYSSGQEIILATPQIPAQESFVMFDLEGMPPQLDELDKIYLWGVQVFGKKPSTYMPAVAALGPDGERQGWEKFLRCANAIFAEYGDIPFVHWAEYEATHIKSCVVRYGDPEGVAARVLANLLNLLPITQCSIALPLPSYSLKEVEKYVGFKRTQKEYGGDWSIAKFIEATETEDEKERAEVMDSILTYNQEDLEATWAVLNWLMKISLN